MMQPRFSVVIAAYNAERTVAETLESVLAQSETNFEIVAIDDGSNDRTLEILLDFAKRDRRILIASQPNSGVAAARNMGIAKAKGELVAFLDADDIWHPKKLERHFELHESNPQIDASYARISFCPDRDGPLRAGRTKSSVAETFCTLEDVLIENAVCTMSNLVVRRQALTDIGGFDGEMRHVEDQDLLARLVGKGRLLWGIAETLVGYRMSADGLSCDFQSMVDAWKSLASRWATHIDMKRGEAIYCRYLARRALRSGASTALARDFLRQGLASDRKAFFEDGSRGVITAGAVIVSGVLPSRTRMAIFA